MMLLLCDGIAGNSYESVKNRPITKVNQINVFTSDRAKKKPGWVEKAKAAEKMAKIIVLTVEVIGL